MKFSRALLARLCLGATVLSLLLPWQTGNGVTRSGFDVDDGRAIFLAALITLVLMQIKFRPAWIGAGFVVAVSGRAIFTLLRTSTLELGIGLVIVGLTALVATCLLLWDMFANVAAEEN